MTNAPEQTLDIKWLRTVCINTIFGLIHSGHVVIFKEIAPLTMIIEIHKDDCCVKRIINYRDILDFHDPDVVFYTILNSMVLEFRKNKEGDSSSA